MPTISRSVYSVVALRRWRATPGVSGLLAGHIALDVRRSRSSLGRRLFHASRTRWPYSCRVAVRIRTAGDPGDFSGAPGDPDDLGEQVAAMWVAGASRPEWCFVAEDESGARVGRVGYRVEPTVTNPAWLGTLPPVELFPFGLWLPWEHGGCDLGRVLFATTLGRLAPELPARLDVEVNPEVDDHPPRAGAAVRRHRH